MDQKTWLWRKRSSEKTIIANGKADDYDVKGKLEVQALPNEKEAALEESVKILNEKLALLTSECDAKEELMQNHARMAEEAVAGQKKAEAEVLHLRKELDEALQQKSAANDRLGILNSALKDCMQQLNVVREEQEQRVNDAIMRTSKEFEKAHKKLEQKLLETSKKLSNFAADNSHLNQAIQAKESLIEDLRNSRSQIEAEFGALMARLDSVEKENAFLRYEFRVLEKDLDIRNQEIEFTRQFADTSQKHYLESMNKAKKLENECQRLRVMMRKRLAAPSLLANLKAEVELQGGRQMGTRRRKTNPAFGGLVVRESTRENVDISSKRISFLVERLQNVEQENKILRDLLVKTDNDISRSGAACTHIDSMSAQGDTQLPEPHKAEQSTELAVSKTMFNEIFSVSDTNLYDEHETSSSRSWTSALISEFENLKDIDHKKMLEHKMLGISDMSLMDDFVEMEKQALVAVDVPRDSYHASLDMHCVQPDNSNREICQNHMDSTGLELVPVGKELDERHEQLQTSDSSSTKSSDWLQAVLNVILVQLHVSGRSIDELLEVIKVALQSGTYEVRSSSHSKQNELLPISGYIAWKSQTSPKSCSTEGIPRVHFCSEETNHGVIQPLGISSDMGPSQRSIEQLETELETLTESKRVMEEQFENQKLMNEELDTQLNVAKARLNDVSHKLSSLEVELEDKNHRCEELEGTCLELQLQLESFTSKEFLEDDTKQEGKLFETGWEIKAASAKLAECEATILNLGNQLKSLTPPKEASNTNKIFSLANNKQVIKRKSLQDRMLSDDATKMNDLKPSHSKELTSTAEKRMQPHYQTKSGRAFYSSSTQLAAAGALVVVPSKKRGRAIGFVRRLLLGRKSGSSKKTPFSFTVKERYVS